MATPCARLQLVRGPVCRGSGGRPLNSSVRLHQSDDAMADKCPKCEQRIFWTKTWDDLSCPSCGVSLHSTTSNIFSWVGVVLAPVAL